MTLLNNFRPDLTRSKRPLEQWNNTLLRVHTLTLPQSYCWEFLKNIAPPYTPDFLGAEQPYVLKKLHGSSTIGITQDTRSSGSSGLSKMQSRTSGRLLTFGLCYHIHPGFQHQRYPPLCCVE